MIFDIEEKYEFNINNNYVITNFRNHPYEFVKLCPDIKDNFTDINFVRKKDMELAHKINETNSVAIHIRRGDYINVKETRNKFGILANQYYHKAMDYMYQMTCSPFFYIFSDDTNWAEENFADIKNKIVIKHNKSRINSTYDNYKTFRYVKFRFKFLFNYRLQKAINDFNLMRCCKHFIIANSTFSWWAGYLGEKKNKIIICPYNWSNKRTSENSTPKEWIRI